MATSFRFIADLERNLANHIIAGSLIFTEKFIYVVKSDGTKVKYGKEYSEIVNILPSTNIEIGKMYLLTSDKSINIYDGIEWNRYGRNDLSDFTTDDLAESETKKFVSPDQINDWDNIKIEVETSRGTDVKLGDRLDDIDERVNEISSEIDGGTF